MDKRNFLIVSVLTVFLCGMILASVGAAHAKTVTMYPEMDKTITKKADNYKIEVLTWKASFYQELDVIPYNKKGEMLKLGKYKVKVYYKEYGKNKVTKWRRRGVDSTYYKTHFSKKAKIKKVLIRF